MSGNSNTKTNKLAKAMEEANFDMFRKYFCVDCAGNALTDPEKTTHERDGHEVMQAYNTKSNHYVFRKTDVERLNPDKGLNVAQVASYSSKGIAHFYIKSKHPNSKREGTSKSNDKGKRKFSKACLYCEWPLNRIYNASFCSILCKLSSQLQDDHSADENPRLVSDDKKRKTNGQNSGNEEDNGKKLKGLGDVGLDDKNLLNSNLETDDIFKDLTSFDAETADIVNNLLGLDVKTDESSQPQDDRSADEKPRLVSDDEKDRPKKRKTDGQNSENEEDNGKKLKGLVDVGLHDNNLLDLNVEPDANE